MKFTLILATALALTCSAAMAKGGSGHSGSHSTSAMHHSGGTHGTHSIGSSTSSSSGADHDIKGYVKKDGTYVAPAHATNPDSKTTNNYTHDGNVNPYSGKVGTKKD